MASDISSNTTNDIGITEKTYATSEVAKMIGIAPVTVRKYSQLLENNGYVFIRSTVKARQKARLYRYKDIEALRYLKEIREQSNITVDQAINVTIERIGKGAIHGVASTDTQEIEQSDKQYSELKQMIEAQSGMIHKQSELLVKQNELILNLTNRIEQQEQLNKPIGHKQIEAPEKEDEQEPVKIKHNKKSLLARIFNINN